MGGSPDVNLLPLAQHVFAQQDHGVPPFSLQELQDEVGY